MKVTRIGIDLAKQVFQVHGVDRKEVVVVRRQLKRSQLLDYLAKFEPCLIGMEACASAHYWARELGKLGHTVKLMAPQFVKPYLKGQKNDANDAQAICEAMGRPGMRFVSVKSVEQQDIQGLHRVRSELVKQRTAKGNQIRGLLGEYGIVLSRRLEVLRRGLPDILEDAGNGLSGAFRGLLHGLWRDLLELGDRVEELDRQVKELARSHPDCRRLEGIPGIGPLSATALVGAVGDARQFKNGRQLAAWLGLVPRQHSSGGKPQLLGISKRGDCYVRTLMIHGARSVQRVCKNKTDERSRWLSALGARRHGNVAAVALANKNARIAWAVLARGESYRPAN